MIQSKQKPSRFLGRRALKLAWRDMDIIEKLPEVEEELKAKQLQWLQEFEDLLFHVHIETTDEDDDSALIWDADGGQNELAKRRQRRQNAAKKRATVTP